MQLIFLPVTFPGFEPVSLRLRINLNCANPFTECAINTDDNTYLFIVLYINHGTYGIKIFNCPGWGSNSRTGDPQSNTLTTRPAMPLHSACGGGVLMRLE